VRFSYIELTIDWVKMSPEEVNDEQQSSRVRI
jgi:hypothetical protein